MPYKFQQSVSAPVICVKEVDAGRETVVEDVGSAVPEVPVQWFMDHILPGLPVNLNLSDVLHGLEATGHIRSGTWTDFVVPPAESPKTEDDVCATLMALAGTIGEQARSALSTLPEPTVIFQCRPRSMTRPLRRRYTSRPDGYGLYVTHPPCYYMPAERPFWETIVAPCEVKKEQTVDNINDVGIKFAEFIICI